MANFPTSVSTNSNLYIAVNGIQTTLAASILTTDTTIQLTSTSGFPAVGYVTIDNSEVVLYTGISGPNLTGCTRGADGTTAAAHSLGVTVGATIVAAHHNLLKDEVIAIETSLGAGYAQSSANTANAVVKRDGSGNFSAGTITAALSGNASTATKSTNLAGGVAGAIPYQTAPDTTGFSAAGSTGDVVLSGGTGAPTFTTPTSAPTASTIMKRDANGNTQVNTVVENFSTTVTAAGTTALTASSSPLQQFTGTTTQTVTLPDATTLTVGYQISVLNRSTGAVTVNNHGGTLQQTIAGGSQNTFTVTSVSTSNGVWDVSTTASGGITQLTSDVTAGPGSGSQAATVVSVGGQSAAAIAMAVQNVDANIIDNPGFTIWQRGTSFSNPGVVALTADRWNNNISGAPSAFTISKETSIVDFTGGSALKLDVTNNSGNAAFGIYQSVENFAFYAGKTITLTMRIRSTQAGLKIAIDDGDTHAGNAAFFSSAIGTTGSYQTVTVTGTLSANTSRILLQMWPSGSAITQIPNGTYYIASATCVIGSQSASFVAPNPEVDLARCQRYFQALQKTTGTFFFIQGQCTSTSSGYVIWPLKVTMRVTPTVTVNNPTNFSVLKSNAAEQVLSALGPDSLSPDSVQLDFTAGSATLAGGNATALITDNVNATVFASADL